MPCNMHNDSSPEDWLRGGDLSIKHNADALRRQLAEVEAMLCMVLRKLEDGGYANFFTQQDFDDAGVPEPHVQEWWNTHRRLDDTRRKAAKLDRERKALIEEALALLSPAHRAALGYKK